ncbi:MAG: TPM domain-containing protein [Bacteroidota bacterium]
MELFFRIVLVLFTVGFADKSLSSADEVLIKDDSNWCKTIALEQEIYVYDHESILTEEEREKISEIIAEHKKKTMKEVLLVTTHSVGKFQDIKAYATHLGNIYSSEVDRKEIVVIAMSKKLKSVAISTSDRARDTLTDITCKNIIDQEIVPSFIKEHYYIGIVKGLERIFEEWGKH